MGDERHRTRRSGPHRRVSHGYGFAGVLLALATTKVVAQADIEAPFEHAGNPLATVAALPACEASDQLGTACGVLAGARCQRVDSTDPNGPVMPTGVGVYECAVDRGSTAVLLFSTQPGRPLLGGVQTELSLIATTAMHGGRTFPGWVLVRMGDDLDRTEVLFRPDRFRLGLPPTSYEPMLSAASQTGPRDAIERWGIWTDHPGAQMVAVRPNETPDAQRLGVAVYRYDGQRFVGPVRCPDFAPLIPFFDAEPAFGLPLAADPSEHVPTGGPVLTGAAGDLARVAFLRLRRARDATVRVFAVRRRFDAAGCVEMVVRSEIRASDGPAREVYSIIAPDRRGRALRTVVPALPADDPRRLADYRLPDLDGDGVSEHFELEREAPICALASGSVGSRCCLPDRWWARIAGSSEAQALSQPTVVRGRGRDPDLDARITGTGVCPADTPSYPRLRLRSGNALHVYLADGVLRYDLRVSVENCQGFLTDQERLTAACERRGYTDFSGAFSAPDGAAIRISPVVAQAQP